MYDVVAMKAELDNATRVARANVRASFVAAFRQIYLADTVPEAFGANGLRIIRTVVRSATDLDQIPYNAGFYVILSDYPVERNDCRLTCGTLRAIYRGQSATVRKRVMSHLLNSAYQLDYQTRAGRYEGDQRYAGKKFYEAHWPHCLKLEVSGRSGIDVDAEPYRSRQWLVVVHRMKGSSQEVRELAELAFDDVFGHPAASRDT